MSRVLTTIRSWWKRVFFWQNTDSQSQEYTAESHHDHALVFSVSKDTAPSVWYQLRLARYVLRPATQRVFISGIVVLLIGLGLVMAGVIQPHVSRLPARGGSITEGVIGSPKLINPLYALNDVDRDLSGLVYSSLFRLNDSLEPEPDLARSWTWENDGRALLVDIRTDARFHDGVQLFSDDVVFTYQTVRDTTWKSPFASTFKNVTVERIDDDTVRFTLEQADPSFLSNLTLGILPSHVWRNTPGPTATLADANLRPIGSGPYQIDTIRRGTGGGVVSYQLRAFDDYYGKRPYIDEWQFRFYETRAEALAALSSKQIDALAFVPWQEADKLQAGFLNRNSISLAQETVVFFNTTKPLTKDVKLRQALTDAIDIQELKDVSAGHDEPVQGPFPYLDNQSTSTPSGVDDARAQLNTLGWKLAEGASIRTQNGNASSTELALAIEVPNQPDLIRVAEYLQRRWSLIGVKVSIAPFESNESILKQQNYDVLVTNILLPSSQDLSAFWSSTKFPPNGRNFSLIANKDIDTALAEVSEATSTEAILDARRALAQTIEKQAPAIFLVRPAYAYLTSNDIRGVSDIRTGRPSDRLLQTMNWYTKTQWVWK